MIRDEVREAIIASLQQSALSINRYEEPAPIDPEPTPMSDAPLSKFDLLDMAILKKYSTK